MKYNILVKWFDSWRKGVKVADINDLSIGAVLKGVYGNEYKEVFKKDVTELNSENVSKILNAFTDKISSYDLEIKKVEETIIKGRCQKETERLKQIILSNCDRISDASNVVEFENRLKIICDLKKQYYSIENESRREAHKKIGAIAYDKKVSQNGLDMFKKHMDLD